MTRTGYRVKPFVAAVHVSRSFLNDDPKMAEALAGEIVRDKAIEPLVRGPRGGMYRPVSPPTAVEWGEAGDDWMRNQVEARVTFLARYVRPSRRSA